MTKFRNAGPAVMQNCKLGITTMSLGYAHAGHDFFHKLETAARYGYSGIELFWGDLEEVASKIQGKSSEQQIQEAARIISRACIRLNLKVISIQPFSQYEGLLDRGEHSRRIEQLRLWLKVACLLHTDLILIPANFLPAEQLAVDSDLAIQDLREAADIGRAARPPIRFAHEALCWSTRTDTWERIWDIVKAVDRPNFGICLDTFNIAGRIYADPTSATGCTANAEERISQSIRRLIQRVSIDKVFLVQVVDAERLSQPLTPSHPFWIQNLPPRMSWSRNCRLFYGEQEHGAYLPVYQLCRAIFLELGYQGYVSLELFNRKMNDQDKSVPEELARRGAISWQKLITDMKKADRHRRPSAAINSKEMDMRYLEKPFNGMARSVVQEIQVTE